MKKIITRLACFCIVLVISISLMIFTIQTFGNIGYLLGFVFSAILIYMWDNFLMDSND